MLQPDAPKAVALTYDEIIFQTRNRAYGAFSLRQQYRPTLTRALGLGIGLFLAGLSAPTVYNWLAPARPLLNDQIMVEADLVKLAEPPAEVPVPLPPVEQAPAVNTVRNLPLVVMPEADVVEETLPPTTDELQEATSGPVTAEGTGDIDVIAPPESSAPTVAEKAIELAPKPDEVFVAVEQDPQFPGGMDALRTFLSKSLNYPRSAANAGISGRVFVSFVVNTDGSLTDVHVLKGIGFGCDEEAIRVIRKMPNWRPGKQSGRAVRVKFNLPIAFTLE
jgi:protein TonB